MKVNITVVATKTFTAGLEPSEEEAILQEKVEFMIAEAMICRIWQLVRKLLKIAQGRCLTAYEGQ
jgi:hypothetical protein